MNVGTYLLLTVPLVGGSLLLYDNLRGGHGAAPESAPISTPPSREEVRHEERPMLAGDATALTERQVREVVERMLAETRAKTAAATGVVPGADGAASPMPLAPPIELAGDPESVTGPAATFDEKTLTVFRAYMQEAQRLERAENQARAVNSQLDALGVSLSDSQRKAVIDATVRHQNQVRETFKQLPGGAEARDARQKAVTELRDAYSKSIYDLVPVSEADKIVKGMGGGWRGGEGFPNGGSRARGAPMPAGGGDGTPR